MSQDSLERVECECVNTYLGKVYTVLEVEEWLEERSFIFIIVVVVLSCLEFIIITSSSQGFCQFCFFGNL